MNAIAMRLVRAVNRNWTNAIRLAPPGWETLTQELDLWQRRGRQARFWWRDDDAVDETAALGRLLALNEACHIPLAMAVVPAGATERLAEAFKPARHLRVLQHGWSHANHALPGRPRAELAEGRDGGKVASELRQGMVRLRDLFSLRFLPVLVPPFNALAPSLASAVTAAGFSFVSVEGDFAGMPVPSRNVHVDPIDWHLHRAKHATALVRQAVGSLRLRRFGLLPAEAPIGIVTHHLQHDEAIWQSIGDLLNHLVSHQAVTFPAIEEIFAP